MRALMHQSFLQKMEDATATMSRNYAPAMTPVMDLASGSSKSSSAQQQPLQQLETRLSLSASRDGTPGTSTASLASVIDDVVIPSKIAAPSGQKAARATATSSATATKPISRAAPTTSANALSSCSQMSPMNQLSITDLLALADLPVETNIPVVNTETGQRLTGDKAPKVKYLGQWLMDHPKCKLDMASMSPVNVSPKPSSCSSTKDKSAMSNNLTASTSSTTPTSANMSNLQTMDGLKLQLLLQQAVFGHSAMAGNNPYVCQFTTAGTSSSGSNSALSGPAADMDAATLATLTALMGSQFSRQLTVSPASLTNAENSTTTPATSATSSSNSNAAATTGRVTETALAAELLANASLYSMLNPSPTTSLNPMQSITGLDMATLAQLSALGATANSSSTSTSTSTQATRPSATQKRGQ